MAAGRHFSYEPELTEQSSNSDGLGAALARLNNLVGLPEDGIAFDLFAILNKDEDAIADLNKMVNQCLSPKLADRFGSQAGKLALGVGKVPCKHR
jgi:hypothetical protein